MWNALIHTSYNLFFLPWFVLWVQFSSMQIYRLSYYGRPM